MKKLEGTPMEKLPFKNLFKVGDLVHFEGPLLSLFSNDKGELYMYDWSDCDEKYNRWLIFRISLNQLIQYLNRNLSHYQLITSCYTDSIYSVDLDNDLNYHNISRLNVDEIPENYLPKPGVLHDDEESPHIDKIKSYINKLELKAAGNRKEKWENKFHDIPKELYEQIITGARKIINQEQLLTV